MDGAQKQYIAHGLQHQRTHVGVGTQRQCGQFGIGQGIDGIVQILQLVDAVFPNRRAVHRSQKKLKSDGIREWLETGFSGIQAHFRHFVAFHPNHVVSRPSVYGAQPILHRQLRSRFCVEW